MNGTSVRLAHHLASGTENEVSMDVECPDVETVNTNANLKVPICTIFTPNIMDENTFISSIAKNSSRWGEASARVIISVKPKYAIKSVGSFIRGHFVEEESSKAASLTAKSATGAKVFCLLKASKD